MNIRKVGLITKEKSSKIWCLRQNFFFLFGEFFAPDRIDSKINEVVGFVQFSYPYNGLVSLGNSAAFGTG